MASLLGFLVIAGETFFRCDHSHTPQTLCVMGWHNAKLTHPRTADEEKLNYTGIIKTYSLVGNCW